jgi:hypothetical protein
MRITDLIWFAVITLFFGATWLQGRATRQSSRVLLESNRKIASDATQANYDVSQALKSIHTLVNSNLSAAQQRELDANRVTLTALQEVVSLKESQGLPVSQDSRTVIRQVKERIAEMAEAGYHTKQQTDIADRQK